MATRKAKEAVEWELGEWKGLPQWRCSLCPWDTLVGEEAMLKHIADVHTPKPPRKVVQWLPLVDRYGNQMVVEKEVEDDGAN